MLSISSFILRLHNVIAARNMSEEIEYSAYIIAFTVLILLVGFFGNIFVLVTFKKNKTLRNPLSLPVANLAVVDTLQALCGVPYIFTLSEGRQLVSNAICQAEALLTSLFVVVSTWTLLLISVNRYIKICRPKLQHLVNKQNTIAGIIFSWTWGVVLVVPPLFGWSSYGYDPRSFVCTTTHIQGSYIATYMFTVVLGPFVGICFSYFHVLRYIRKKRDGISTFVTSNRRRHQERSLSVMLGIVVASYFCFYAPITSTYFYEMVSGKPVPTAYRLVTLLIVTMNNANNPIVYGLMNSNFRKAFLDMFRKRNPTRRILPSAQQLRGKRKQQRQPQSQPLSRINQEEQSEHKIKQIKIELEEHSFASNTPRSPKAIIGLNVS